MGVGRGVSVGNGGKNAGICGGGLHFAVLCRLRGGVAGLEIGERGKGGVACRGGTGSGSSRRSERASLATSS